MTDNLVLRRHRLRPAPLSSPSSKRRLASVLRPSIYTHKLFTLFSVVSLLFFVSYLSQIKRCFFFKPASPPASESFQRTAPRAQRLVMSREVDVMGLPSTLFHLSAPLGFYCVFLPFLIPVLYQRVTAETSTSSNRGIPGCTAQGPSF